jgi:cytidylate kinase
VEGPTVAVITISRQEGSGGNRLARGLAKALDYRLVDKESLTRVAGLALVSAEHEESAQGGESPVMRFLHALARGLPDLDDYYQAYSELYAEHPEAAEHYVHYGREKVKADFSRLPPSESLRFFKSAIRELAERGNVILIGRGSQVLLADFPHTLHVRVTAAHDQRVATVARQRGVSEDLARDTIREADDFRADYLKANYDRDVDDASLYDLVLSMNKLAVDDAATFIRSWVTAETVRHEAQLRGEATN